LIDEEDFTLIPTRYLEAVRGVLDHLENTQLENVEKAADIVVESISNGGMIYCSAVGHGNEQDFINRAGGLAVVRQLSWGFSVNSPVPEHHQNRPRPEPFEADLEEVRFALRASNVRPGDVVVIGSVSGRNRRPVELALACREMGVKVIGFTSFSQSLDAEPLHPSGKKLSDVADVVLDNGAPYGDAALEIPGYDTKALPLSGVSMITLGWMIWGRVMEKMAEAGKPATVFTSVNVKGGQDRYNEQTATYNKRGY
jgi:uncharacterized phosphosugar-binding protein